MNLTLVKAGPQYCRQITEMLEEWFALETDITPWAICRGDYRDFEKYCESLEIREEDGIHVPDVTFFCLDTDRDRMVGAVNIRLRLNDRLLRNGGHIGDGVRPTERGKGIGTKMVGLALEQCRSLGIRKVLMVCDRENPASAKTILHNGGILENEVVVDGVTEQRYWITLK